MLQGYKTYLGILIAIAPTIVGLFGYDLTPMFGDEFSTLAVDAITLGGALLAFYGRLVATVPGWFAKR